MILDSFRYVMPVRVEYGLGAAAKAGEELAGLGCKKPFIVTDRGVIGAGLLHYVTDSLEEKGLKYEIFDKVVGNPTDVIVHEGIDAYAASGCDSFIAVGGGSSIDTSKAIGMVYRNGGNVREYDNDRPGTHPSPIPMDPLITIPTTAGTGSSVTPYAVVTDTERHWKMSLCSAETGTFAKVALIDPVMTASMPGSLAAATGMDALTHAIEAILSKNANVFSDLINIKAVELIMKNLRQSVANGGNLEARGAVLLGNVIAGWGFQQVGLGAAHALSHMLGGQLNVPHGVGNAMMLPYVMEYNMVARLEKYPLLAQAMGLCTDGLSDVEIGDKVCAAVLRLSKDIGIPRLREVQGIDEANLPRYAELALLDGNTLNNPRIPTKEDYLELYKKAW